MEKQNDLMQPRVALLIDADNFSARQAEALFGKAAVYGNIIVRKAYGVGMGSGFKWSPEVLHRYAIEPVVRFHYASGKNVADIALVIDAMELMRRQTVDAVCIASNDSDFSLLAMKLRENGIKVYGFGDNSPASAFISSCDEYTNVTLPDDVSEGALLPREGAGVPPERTVPVQTAEITDIKKIIHAACDSLNSDDEGWINMAAVGTYIRRVNPAFSPKNYGFSKLRELVESMDDFDVNYDKATQTNSVRKASGSVDSGD